MRVKVQAPVRVVCQIYRHIIPRNRIRRGTNSPDRLRRASSTSVTSRGHLRRPDSIDWLKAYRISDEQRTVCSQLAWAEASTSSYFGARPGLRHRRQLQSSSTTPRPQSRWDDDSPASRVRYGRGLVQWTSRERRRLGGWDRWLRWCFDETLCLGDSVEQRLSGRAAAEFNITISAVQQHTSPRFVGDVLQRSAYVGRCRSLQRFGRPLPNRRADCYKAQLFPDPGRWRRAPAGVWNTHDDQLSDHQATTPAEGPTTTAAAHAGEVGIADTACDHVRRRHVRTDIPPPSHPHWRHGLRFDAAATSGHHDVAGRGVTCRRQQ